MKNEAEKIISLKIFWSMNELKMNWKWIEIHFPQSLNSNSIPIHFYFEKVNSNSIPIPGIWIGIEWNSNSIRELTMSLVEPLYKAICLLIACFNVSIGSCGNMQHLTLEGRHLPYIQHLENLVTHDLNQTTMKHTRAAKWCLLYWHNSSLQMHGLWIETFF